MVHGPVLVPLPQPGRAEQRVEQVRPLVEQSGRGHLWEAAGKRVRLVGNLVLATRQPEKQEKLFLLDSSKKDR